MAFNDSTGLLGFIGIFATCASLAGTETVKVVPAPDPTTAETYAPVITGDTVFDATQWVSTVVAPPAAGGQPNAVKITDQGEASRIVWRGGVIHGRIPATLTWTETHDGKIMGGSGLRYETNGAVELRYLRIHNVEDGIKIREKNPQGYTNLGRWLLHDSYFTAIRDDCVDNDRFVPGTIQNCLFDGIYTFLSEQQEVRDDASLGPDEDRVIHLDRVYVRSFQTNATDPHPNRQVGLWLKWQGAAPHHHVVIRDSVFAVGPLPAGVKWSNFNFPADLVTWKGHNYLLWLGPIGGYRGAVPAGVHFLEGPAAESHWRDVRNRWLVAHGLPSQGELAADYNPHTLTQVEQIPAHAASETPIEK